MQAQLAFLAPETTFREILDPRWHQMLDPRVLETTYAHPVGEELVILFKAARRMLDALKDPQARELCMVAVASQAVLLLTAPSDDVGLAFSRVVTLAAFP